MRGLKWLGYAIAGVVVIVIIALVSVALFFDPNKYKNDIESLAQKQLHRQVSLQGDLKLSLFPWLAVQVGAAQIGERAEFGDQPFVSIQSARLSIRLLPLLHGAVEIGDVRLDKPAIHLITDERGRHNWSDLAGDDQTDKTSHAESSKQSGAVSASVASLEIREGSLVIDDRKEKSRTAIRDFFVSTGAISSARPFDLKVSFIMEQDKHPATPVKLNARVTADFDQQRHHLQDVTFDTRWFGEHKGDGVPVTLHVASLDADLRQQTLAVNELQATFGPAKLTGNIVGKEIMDAPQLSGHVQVTAFSPRELMKSLSMTPPVTRDDQVLKEAQLQADLAATKNSVAMQKLQLKLDDTTATGELSIIDLDAMALRMNLNVDRIDFDRYLPPPEKNAPAANAKESPPTPIPVDLLRALNARGDLRVASAKFGGMKLSSLHVGVNARDGNVQFAPTDAAIYGGEYRGSMGIDATGKTPKLAIESHASNVDFAPLFKDMFDTQRVSGHGAANLKASGVGNDTLAMQKSLNGTVDFNVTNGAFEGTDLWYEIRRARALLHREAPPAAPSGPARTPFTSCKGTGTIHDGVLANNDLDIAMQYLKVAGQGTVDIPKSTLDYRLTAQVLHLSDDASAGDLVGTQIPVKITGTLASPSVRPDIEGLAKARINQEVEKQKDKLREKLQDKLKDILGGKG